MTGMERVAALVERLAAVVAAGDDPVTEADRRDLARLLPLIAERAAAERLAFDDERGLALAVHALGFVRRVRCGHHLDALDAALAEELAPRLLAAARTAIDTYCAPLGFCARDAEVLLLALHLAMARQGGPGNRPTPRQGSTA
ncbi:hypothetical protein GCM10010211_51110 [Streptomyces albospinus]|uniref:PRD domain-containing protein n=1 Tax=Streptomyces albospinus TaxID=285515 RepID=A0ABQ2VEX8_9ACTN|nr:hypothetical protein [Streptomyces albospinus]GGU78942.1 hypothetical protein GCM10010211_51110 [Streptomyces albospinus]